MTVGPDLVEVVLRTGIAVGVLLVLTVIVLVLFDIPDRLSPVTAILRGAAQLAVISFVLSGVIRSGLWVGAALLVMFGIAAWTAARRLGGTRRLPRVAAAMATGVLVSSSVVFLSGAIPLTARYALAIGGIVIGNSMSITTLAGRRFIDDVADQWDVVESWLALGATPRQATSGYAQRAVRSALIPTIDQTRTTGLVTLPGAFVGAIFGGLSPFEAGRFQIVVLASIVAAGTLTSVLLVDSLRSVRTKPAALSAPGPGGAARRSTA